MKHPWEIDDEEVPDDAGIGHDSERRRILLIAVILWGIIIGAGGLVYLVGTPGDGGVQIGDVTLQPPSLVVDLDGESKRLILDLGPKFGVVIDSNEPAVRFVVVGETIEIGNVAFDEQ